MALVKKRGSWLPTLRSNFSELLDMDRFFDESTFRFPFWNGGFDQVPATNIKETDNEFVVELAAPGLTRKDFLVDIDNNMLEIKVEKEEETKEDKKKYTRREYNYNAFYRCFDLPNTVEGDKIKAEYKDGILKVHLPKVPAAKTKPVKEIAVS